MNLLRVEELRAEYRAVFDSYLSARQMGLNYRVVDGYMERAFNLYKDNQMALSNGCMGNRELINNQMGLELILGIADSYVIN